LAYPIKKQFQYDPYTYTTAYTHTYRPVHGYSHTIPGRPARRKVRRGNFLKTLFGLAFLGLIAYYVMPTIYTDYFEPIVLNRYLNRHIKPDAAKFVSPTLNYAANGTLFSQNIRTPLKSKKKLLTPIVSSGINAHVEAKLLNLAARYPGLKPSIYIWDYSTAQSVEINSDIPIATASIIKIPVLFELFRQIEDKKYGFQGDTNTRVEYEELYRTSGSGELQYKKAGGTYSIDYLANVMITKSDNTATNIILDHIGGKATMNRALRSWGLTNSYMSELLPDLSGTNRMSAKDVSTILYNLDNPTFLSTRSKELIKDYMYNVENQTLLKAGLPKDAVLLHKTGDIGTMLGDAGIVYRTDGKKYLITIMVRRPHNDYRARDFIKEASAVVYKNL